MEEISNIQHSISNDQVKMEELAMHGLQVRSRPIITANKVSFTVACWNRNAEHAEVAEMGAEIFE